MKEETVIELSALKEGMELFPIERQILQSNINLYAEASLDFNPIHIDQEFAKKTPLGGTIAHGMLVLGYVSHMMTVNFGDIWITGGKLSVRFKAPARPGDTVTVSGTVRKILHNEDSVTIKCDVVCQNQNGETVITSEAVVRTAE